MKISCSIKTIFTTTVFMILVVPLTFRIVLASSCDSISNLDDRAACYAKQIEEKQNVYESISQKLDGIKSQKDAVSAKIANLSTQLNVKQDEVDGIQADIDKINKELNDIEGNLSDRRGTVEVKTELRNTVIRNYAKTYRTKDIEMFTSLLGGERSGFSVDGLSYGFAKYFVNNLSSLIYTLNQEIDSFEKDKAEASDLKTQTVQAQNALLVAVKALEASRGQVAGEFSTLSNKENEYQGDLSDLEKEISSLSAKQEAILEAKNGGSSSSLGEGVETDDPRTSASYKPSFSPAFAAFSYGAYTHRNGMSQYGARGRAEDGQNADRILKFYYKTDTKTDSGLDSETICIVKTDGSKIYKKLGDYLKGLGEMPSSWGGSGKAQAALEAQAIAARTYASRYMEKNSCICTTTSCQYYSTALENSSGRDNWYEAVKDTKDKILSGSVSAQYSSTTGGWINGVGWDTDGGSWPGDAYELKGGSPWFYKAWFTQTYVKTSSTCGRSSPWLNGEEMADILNAYILLKAQKNTERLVPETINQCPLDGVSGKPYSKSELRSKAASIDSNTGFEKVTDSSVTYGEGKTATVKFKTNKGDYTVSDGLLFAKAFNLRAPGYIAIKYAPDSKALYNILKK